jgi:hypothetical protein
MVGGELTHRLPQEFTISQDEGEYVTENGDDLYRQRIPCVLPIVVGAFRR